MGAGVLASVGGAEMKLTEWYPGDVKPVRSGVYQQWDGRGWTIGYQRWNGRKWYAWFDCPEAASTTHCAASSEFQNDPWRGLAQDPKGSKK
jgi:hypothetical protein